MTPVWPAAQPSPPLSRRMVSGDVYAFLTAAILRNEIPPASRININSVANALGVSATPVREALARLESDGLVEQVHLKGYRTTGLLRRREIEELWQFRMLFEPYGAARAATVGTDAELATLRDEQREFPAAPEGSGFDAYREFSAHDSRLHDTILRISGNEVITKTFERMHCHLHAFRLAYDSSAGSATVDEHATIVDRIVDRDPAGASEAMLDHLARSRDRLLQFVGDDDGPPHGPPHRA
ncbi:GntR family transcriptional regulator [Isoptericola sp. NPDC057191]|uniref:GntR family transcriptional regulator n=1 Tax=Isoptericola sp. NPDC057191 TaxID=3346041 RepID=UPI0036416D66